MSMTSMLFLFLFLPLSLVLYSISGKTVKEYVLLAVSLLFYALCSVDYIILFTAAIVITVTIGRIISRSGGKTVRKCLLVTGIIINTSLLIYYKYADFAISTWGSIVSAEVKLTGLALPLGISFFTFKAISYLADVYKSTVIPERHPIHDALYLSFFPQVQSGPLSRYNELARCQENKFQLFSDGVFRFIVGFSKKVLIANVLSGITTEIFAAPMEDLSTLYAWVGSICYSLQLLFDFAGYSDMAIGITEMFGYQCRENFHYPYMTESVTKFWRRWHISLGQWFRDYIYIPMGGSRTKAGWRVYINLFVVWALTGIWHGAAWNFVFWGLGYFMVIAFERMTNLPGRIRHKWGKTVYRILTLLFINFQWVLFRSEDLVSGLKYIGRMIAFHPDELADFRAVFLLRDYWIFILAAVLLCFPIVPWLNRKLEGRKTLHTLYEAAVTLIAVAAFAWSVSFVVAGLNNPFAYANF